MPSRRYLLTASAYLWRLDSTRLDQSTIPVTWARPAPIRGVWSSMYSVCTVYIVLCLVLVVVRISQGHYPLTKPPSQSVGRRPFLLLVFSSASGFAFLCIHSCTGYSRIRVFVCPSLPSFSCCCRCSVSSPKCSYVFSLARLPPTLFRIRHSNRWVDWFGSASGWIHSGWYSLCSVL